MTVSIENSQRMQHLWLQSYTQTDPSKGLAATSAYVDALEIHTHHFPATRIDVQTGAFVHTYLGVLAQKGQGLVDDEVVSGCAQLQGRLHAWLSTWAPKVAETAFFGAIHAMNTIDEERRALPGNAIERSIAGERLVGAFAGSLSAAIETMRLAQVFESPSTQGVRNTDSLVKAVECWRTHALADPWTSKGNHEGTHVQHAHFVERLQEIDARAGTVVANDYGMDFQATR